MFTVIPLALSMLLATAQEPIEEHPTPARSGVHAYRIAPAVRADVCALFGRHTQES